MTQRQETSSVRSPPGHEPRCSPGGGHGRVEADGPYPLGSLGEDRGEKGQCRGRRHGGPDPLGRTGGRSIHPAGAKPPDQRAQGEHGDADEEHAPSAEQVACPGPEEEQASEGEDVGVEHP